jgi:Cdc6-like AAA superfamily ATPase
MKGNLLTDRSIELIAMKVDKLSGDLRQAFDILRAAIQAKI